MSRGMGLFLVLLMIFGASFISAQPESPEPVLVMGNFAEPEAVETAESIPAAYFWNPAGNLPEPLVLLPVAVLAAAGSSDAEPAIPQSIRNNRYFVESVRLTNLAQESYEYGDYDASTNYAAEALRYAQLSDEYVALQLKINVANDAIAAAKARLDWAAANDVSARYPKEYGEARNYYDTSLSARSAQDWDTAITAASNVLYTLAFVEALERTAALPAQYTVWPWAVARDCLWNIAGRPWAYGDPNKWRLLYEANKSKMPQPDNPDLIHPDMILDIPALQGETRQGMWDAGRDYTPLH
ncbi:MAG: LysM peptidoglycan-binding domain-containing protein [Treponema sp.]|jgi:hypothetical protein|nr:LysM peptidoglycan-binding domain-containing protein [Treponema sp.]